MDSSHTTIAGRTQKRSGVYAAWSFLSLLPLLLLASFWHSPKQSPGYLDIGAFVLVVVVASVCSWAFLRCPARPLFVKLVTLLSLLVALFYLGLIGWIYFFRQ